MREIVLDTETTGLDPGKTKESGHRLVEIGCLELDNLIPTGRVFHCYINPERDMPAEAQAIHGLSGSFLSQHPIFEKHVDSFLDFIGDAPLVIHNASFDMKFLNAELGWHGREILPMTRALDTLKLARSLFPGAPASLDALCKRFEIDLSGREKHGALLDAELLAQVYLELKGGRQPGFSFASASKEKAALEEKVWKRKDPLPSRNFPLTPEERENHEALLQKFKEPLWKQG
ncbi:DNA polymerase III subunit epsilon [Candidatus Bealeia paramacronuclearis]|uniref:DNA polymerase III subunit epsilon n=1 Tax=Candidatus Bealeia paramacronuclearis TaxID=1921001 RepID=A0ABZ2C4F7_9PROT|nr:DNA polymerase III subunit epsilon [Candidatus Bealeia paramacronuclearis]